MGKGGREGWRVKKGGEREGASEGWGAEGGRVGGTERGKEGRRMGTRAKHWTMPRQAVISTQQHKLSH